MFIRKHMPLLDSLSVLESKKINMIFNDVMLYFSDRIAFTIFPSSFSCILQSFYIFYFLSGILWISRSSSLPRISVSMQFACTVYWWTAECTQPSGRFMTRWYARAYARNFAREYQGIVGFEQVSLQTPRSVFRVWHCACFFSEFSSQSFLQDARVDYFPRYRHVCWKSRVLHKFWNLTRFS